MSFFQLGTNLGYGRHPTPIDYQGNVIRPCTTVLPLDPIQKSVVGRVRVDKLRRFAEEKGLVNLVQYLRLLNSDDRVPDWVVSAFDRNSRPTGFVGNKYHSHFTDLENCGLIERVSLHEVLFNSTYFCVNKTLTEARSIFNGELLSLRCPLPDPVNLADTKSVVDGFHEFFAAQNGRRKRCFTYMGDFRHWFHQISAPDWMRRLFGLRRANGTQFRWCSIPMGWSWSPLLAQTTAWSVLLSREDHQKPILDEEAFKKPGGQLPTWVDVLSAKGEVVGRATVYYDNFIFLVDNADDLARVKSRMEQNCGPLRSRGETEAPDHASTGAHCKPLSVECITSEQFCQTGFDFLGVHFQGRQAERAQQPAGQAPEQKRGRRERQSAGGIAELLWWPAKTEAWKEVAGGIASRMEGNASFTLREAAQVAGQAVFAANMSRGGVHSFPWCGQLLGAAREIGRQAHGVELSEPNMRKDAVWECLAQTGAWSRELSQVWNTVSQVDSFYYRTPLDETLLEQRKEYLNILCTDASTQAIGWCGIQRPSSESPFDANTTSHKCEGRPLSPSEQTEHIFILEVRAALEALRSWCVRNPSRAHRVTLVVDNSATAFALRHGFSGNVKASKMLAEAREDLARVEDVILVISEDNPSDCCSRNTVEDWRNQRHLQAKGHVKGPDQCKSFADRARDAITAIQARIRGWNWASEKRAQWSEKERRRKAGARQAAPREPWEDLPDYATVPWLSAAERDESEPEEVTG